MFDEAPFGKSSLPLAEAGRLAVCVGGRGSGEADCEGVERN